MSRDNFLEGLGRGYPLDLKTILLPVKGFPAEGDAITLAFFLAECANSHIHILHVCEEGERAKLLEGFVVDEIVTFATELMMQKRLSFETVEGHNPAKAVLSKAREIKADLIVMGAQRLRATHELFGSHSSEIARRAEVPVFTVFTPFEDWLAYRRVQIRRMLIPYRTIDVDMVSLKLAAATASSAYRIESPNIEIHLAHVIKLPDILPLDASSPEIKQEEKKFLHDVANFTSVIGEPLTPRILVGRDFSKTIVEFTKKLNFDLLIITAKQRPRIFGGLIGSDVYNIAKRARCTTVVVFR